MKLSWEPSRMPERGASADAVHTAVSIEHPYDDLTVDEAVSLFRSLLLAAGYAEQTVAAALDGDCA